IGASGFIGSAIGRALIGEGYEVVAFGRDLVQGRRLLPEAEWRTGDLRSMTQAARWIDYIHGIDFVVNASGALQTGLRDKVPAVQRDAIVALAEAAKRAGTRHFVQVSAAGADTATSSDFMTSKAEADAVILASGLRCTILRPGLVIGRNAFGGTELIRVAAALPGLSPSIAGTGAIQCVALSDVIATVLRVLGQPEMFGGSFDLVEAQPRSLGSVIAAHRAWLGFAPARWHPVLSVTLLKPVTVCADLLGWLGWRSPLRSNAIAALIAGVHGSVEQSRAALGREPLSLDTMLWTLGPSGKADRWHARLALIFPLALAILCAVWLISGVLGLSRTAAAASLLEQGGFTPAMTQMAVIAGSLVDIALALAIMIRPSSKTALTASLVVGIGYCLGALTFRPDLWLDPLAPMLKVLPMLCLTLACLAMADER
ncbi:MAG: SDR family oxidoreductase, partial [Sphingomonadales bacterium]|nr:SDR family oxidoreductase [Sphingomonadales bacterium]